MKLFVALVDINMFHMKKLKEISFCFSLALPCNYEAF